MTALQKKNFKSLQKLEIYCYFRKIFLLIILIIRTDNICAKLQRGITGGKFGKNY
jgi:hypothetical protein